MADLSLTTRTFTPARPKRGLGLLSFAALWRQRSALAHMTDHQLHDIGITREQAQAEADRPLWDVPAHWMQ